MILIYAVGASLLALGSYLVLRFVIAADALDGVSVERPQEAEVPWRRAA